LPQRPRPPARPIEREHYDETNVEVITDYCDLDGRPDLTVRRVQHFVGTFQWKSRGPDDLPYSSDHLHYTTARTNLANGQSITSDGTTKTLDRKLTDNGNGTSTVRVSSLTSDFSYDNSGTTVHRFVGRNVYELLIDNGGTPKDPSDDEFLEFLGNIRENTQVNSPDLDFCEVVHDVID
jgi:hypothetical protein